MSKDSSQLLNNMNDNKIKYEIPDSPPTDHNPSSLIEDNLQSVNFEFTDSKPEHITTRLDSLCNANDDDGARVERYLDEEYDFDLLCSICNTTQWKYKCPRCLIRTCSLSCVRQHKSQTNCSGVRDKTCYVPMSDYNENNFYSDFFFLEDANRCVDVARRDTANKNIKMKQKSHQNILKFEMKKRGIEFNFAPEGIAVRNQNKTYYNRQTKTIFWTIKFVFTDSQRTEYTSFKASELTKLSEILLSYIHPVNGNEITRLKLKEYATAYEVGGVDTFLCKLIQPDRKFVTLDLDQSLMENFTNTIINEIPKILVDILTVEA